MFAAKLDQQRRSTRGIGGKVGVSRGKGNSTRMPKDDAAKKALFFDDETRSMSTAQTSTLTESIVSSIRQHHSQKGRRGRERDVHQRHHDHRSGGDYDHFSSSSSSLYSLQRSHSIRPRHSRSSRFATGNRCSSTNNSSSSKGGPQDSFDSLKLRGRDELIKTWDESIVADKSNQLVLLSGASGSGKSRLAYELACPKRNNSASRDSEDDNRPTSLWTLGAKFDARHNSPYAVFSLIIEDLYHSLLPQEGKEDEDVASCEGAAASDATTVMNGNHHPTHHEGGEIPSSPHRSSMLYSFICTRLRQALDDEESELLIEFVPALRDMLNVRSLDFKSDLEEREDARLEMGDVQRFAKTELKFQSAFRKVIRGLAKSFGNVDSRLVLVFDDLQWADRASLDLIKEILSDTDASHRTKKRAGGLIVIGCYRDDHEDETKAVKTLVNELQGPRGRAGRGGASTASSFGVLVHELKVDHLLQNEVGSMVTEMMAISSTKSRDGSQETDIVDIVADRVYQKTTGNPFFTIQYMRALLGSDNGTLAERMDTFDASRPANFNVMDIIRTKLQKLPNGIKRLLPILGSLGFTFQRSVFIQIVNYFARGASDHGEITTPIDVAEICTEEGMIEANGAEWYRWKHVSFQEATQYLVDETELVSLQFELARFMFSKLAYNELDESLFVIANLFIRGGIRDRKSSLDDTCQIDLAKFFLRVGRKATEYSSFETAVSYLNAGIDLLPELTSWSIYYDLSLNLYSVAAEAEYCTGDFDAMKIHCDEVIGQKHCPLLDKQRVYHALLDSIAKRDTTENATRLCLDLLSKLGCKIPKSSHGLHTAAGLIKVKMSIGKFKKEDLSKYDAMKDPTKLWAMKLMDKLLQFLYVERSPMVPIPILKSLRWTVKYGTSDWSMPALAAVGFMLSAFMEDFSGGEAYATRAIELLEKSGSAVTLPKTYLCAYGMVVHWTKPYSVCRTQLLKAHDVGLKIGDMTNALLCCLFSTWFSLLLGNPLGRVVIDMESFVARAQRVKDSNAEQSASISLEAVRQLSSVDIGERDLLACESIDESELTRLNLYPTLNFFQLYVNFYFGDHQSVVEFIEKNGDKYFEKMLPGVPLLSTFVFFAAVSFLNMARETGNSKYEKMAKGFTKRIKTWVDKGQNPNVVQYRALLDAEWAGLKGKPEEAIHTYNVAILMAERRGLVQDLALAHELCSGFYSRIGLREEAREHLTKARNLYEEWGAQAVARRLMKEYSEYFDMPAEVEVQ